MAKNNGYRISTLKVLVSRMSEGATSPHAKRFVEVGEKLLVAVEALRELDAKPNPTESTHSNEMRVARSAQRLGKRVTELEGEALAALNGAKAEIEGEIAKKIKLEADPRYEAEIRSVFRSLPKGEQLAMMERFAVANDGASLAAIFAAPDFLSGVSPEHKSLYKGRIRELHASAEIAQLNRLVEQTEPTFMAAKVARDYAGDFVEPAAGDPQKAAEISRQKDAALAAIAAFDAVAPVSA